MWNSERIIFPNFTSKYRVKPKKFCIWKTSERNTKYILRYYQIKTTSFRESVYTDLVIDWVSRRENPRAYWRLCWTNCKSSSETSTSLSSISDRSSGGRIIFLLFFLPIAVSLLTQLVSNGNFHWTPAKPLWFWSFWLGLDSTFAFYICVFSFFFFSRVSVVDFLTINSIFINPQTSFFSHFLLKMDPMILFIHLKIILL